MVKLQILKKIRQAILTALYLKRKYMS